MHRLCRDGKVASIFPQRSESEFARFTAQEAFFEAERPFHAVHEWSKYLAEPSEHPQPSHRLGGVEGRGGDAKFGSARVRSSA